MEAKDINQRVRSIIDFTGLSDLAFSKEIKVPQSTLSGIFQRDADTRSSVLIAILNRYPEVSAEWLMRGTGAMVDEGFQPKASNPYQDSGNPLPVIPSETIRVVQLDTADWVRRNNVKAVSVNQLIPYFDMFIEMQSDSMSPTIEKGDMLTLRLLPQNGEVVDGECYAIDTNSRGIIIRNAYDKGDSYSCNARNHHYGSITISKSDVINVFQVVGLVRSHISSSDDSSTQQIERIMDNFGELVKQNSNLINYITRKD